MLERLDRGAAWTPYVAALRTANRRKRKLLEILDGLEGRRRAILEDDFTVLRITFAAAAR